ncbi:helix-turn-helix transcriptional regulator [Anabaena sp. FACHB-83]|nr:helix-turn-helix transcriptional regulator [Anabaena sp. FACHB-83]
MRNRIKEFVDSRGISVYQFWHETGISRTTAYNLYNNSAQYPARDVMDAICTRYGIQPDILLKWIPVQEQKNEE